MMNAPLISVVMAVYNGGRFLAESVDSILGQSFGDFEFLIIDDGSTDETPDTLGRYQQLDARVVVYRQANQGQVPSLNTGCRMARGRYIARIDADDVAMPERFARQVEYLEGHPEVALLGSSITNIDVAGRPLGTWPLPTDDREIRERLFGLGEIPFCHVTLMFRSEVVRALNGYRTAFAPAEDYDLWLRIAERSQLANLPEPLVNVRRRAHSLSFTNARQQVISRLVAREASAIRRQGGRDPVDQQEPVSREQLRSLGVGDAIFEQQLMGIYQYWIEVMLRSGDNDGALRMMRHALESEPWRHVSRSVVANLWLAAARLYSEQGRYLQSAACTARALAVRPVIAGRPIKRIASQLGILNNGAARA